MALPAYATAPGAGFTVAEFLRLVARRRTLSGLSDRELRALVALGGRAGADGCLYLDPADFAAQLGWERSEVCRVFDALAARCALHVEARAPTCVCVTLLWGWSRSTPPSDHADHLAAQRTQLANLNAVLRARTEALALAQERIAALQRNLFRARNQPCGGPTWRRVPPNVRADRARRHWQAKWTAEWEAAS